MTTPFVDVLERFVRLVHGPTCHGRTLPQSLVSLVEINAAINILGRAERANSLRLHVAVLSIRSDEVWSPGRL